MKTEDMNQMDAERDQPNGMSQEGLLKDELQMLEVYRRAKRLGYADIQVSIQEGTRIKLWLTEKMK